MMRATMGERPTASWKVFCVLGLMTTLLLAPLAAAAPGSSCTVDTSTQASHTCQFTCTAGDFVVSGTATSGTIGMSGSCGGGSVGCEAEAPNNCSKKGTASSAGQGTCTIDDKSGTGSGSGSCGAVEEQCGGSTVEKALCQIVGPLPIDLSCSFIDPTGIACGAIESASESGASLTGGNGEALNTQAPVEA